MSEIALFSFDGFLFVLRWIHFFFGVTWIGLLYYFNFVQGSFFAETDASTKNNAISKLVPRALWWFRWGAMWTMASGVCILLARGHQAGHAIYMTSWGVAILTGAALGLTMWANVWFIIWPNQKIVIASAQKVVGGGQADPAAAAAGARAGLASRHNVLFSLPMLFFMGAASHLPISMSAEPKFGLYWLLFFIVLGALEFNSIKGKLGPLTSVKGVVHMGVVLALVIYAMMEFIL